MATKPKVNAAVMERKIRATVTASRVAADAGIRSLGGTLVEILDQLSPKDTHRYVNGWILAGRDAGVTEKQPYPLVESARRSRFVQRLTDQITEYEKLLKYYEGRVAQHEHYAARARQDDFSAGPRQDGRPRKRRVNQPWYQRNTKKINEYKRKAKAAEKRLQRAAEERAKVVGDATFIFFDRNFSGRNLSTVRTTVYGGVGRIDNGPRGPTVHLTNREPHVRPVERNSRLGHPATTAKALIAAAGKTAAVNAYRAELRKRSPLAA